MRKFFRLQTTSKFLVSERRASSLCESHAIWLSGHHDYYPMMHTSIQRQTSPYYISQYASIHSEYQFTWFSVSGHSHDPNP
jgi:hypothetical protein